MEQPERIALRGVDSDEPVSAEAVAPTEPVESD